MNDLEKLPKLPSIFSRANFTAFLSAGLMAGMAAAVVMLCPNVDFLKAVAGCAGLYFLFSGYRQKTLPTNDESKAPQIGQSEPVTRITFKEKKK